MTYNFNQWKGKRLLAIGDVMLDEYIGGIIERVNPEAPGTPLLKITRRSYRLGGAANVAHNIQTLGGEVYLHGITGEDLPGDTLVQLCTSNEISFKRVIDTSRPTTVKTRYTEFERLKLLFRADNETTDAVTAPLQETLLRNIQADADHINPQAALVSDYKKGVITQYVGEKITQLCHEKTIPLLVDCKPSNVHAFHGATLLKPNITEAEELTQTHLKKDKNGLHRRDNLVQLCKNVQSVTNVPYIVLTCGKEGMVGMNDNSKEYTLNAESFLKRDGKVVDVTGAGDTVLATLGLYFAAHYRSGKVDLGEAMALANAAASVVVQELGTSTVSHGELILEFTRRD